MERAKYEAASAALFALGQRGRTYERVSGANMHTSATSYFRDEASARADLPAWLDAACEHKLCVDFRAFDPEPGLDINFEIHAWVNRPATPEEIAEAEALASMRAAAVTP